MSDQGLDSRGSATGTDLRAPRGGAVEFSVRVRGHPAGFWFVLEVVGEMNRRAFPLIPDLVGGDTPHIVLELRGVSFMDGRGLAAMLEARHRARTSGGWVRLVAPSSSVRRVLELTGYDRMFPTFDTLDQAVSTKMDTDLEQGSEPAF